MNAAKRSKSVQHPQLNIEEATDQILYLRSFSADAAPAAQEGMLRSFSMRTEEELLADAASVRGRRFFALGRPGEPLPELGAERLYFQENDWKANAVYLMQRAALVIIRPHGTPPILWELEQIIDKVPPERVTFWIPQSAWLHWALFVNDTRSVFPS